MKNKKSKKFYALTEKQKRKDRRHKGWRWSVPKFYRQMFNDEFDAKCKQAMVNVLKGKEVEFPVFVKDIRYFYW